MSKSLDNKLSKVLLIIGYAFVVAAIFCLMFPGITITVDGKTISMFAWIFGNGIPIDTRPIGLIIMFVLQIIVIFLGVIIIVGLFTKKISRKGIIILVIVSCALILTCSILSFFSKRIIINAFARYYSKNQVPAEEITRQISAMMRAQKIGYGAIMYGSFTATGLLSCVGGLVAY